MDDPVIVKEAGEKGKGVFARRGFHAGDCILRFRGRVVHRDELAALTPWEREHLGELTAETYQILPRPRCYINHACLPNAYSTNDAVYAWRGIATDENRELPVHTCRSGRRRTSGPASSCLRCRASMRSRSRAARNVTA